MLKITDSVGIELCDELRSLDEFQQFAATNPSAFDPARIANIASAILEGGAIEPLTGHSIPAGELEGVDNLREGLAYNSLNSRLRAVLLCLSWVLPPDPKIYAPEAVTGFALRLRGMFPKFIGSEYATSEAERRDLFPIPSEDLQALSFDGDVFDVVITNEVLEHVPSIDAALTEICRVLKPGGWHIGTVPFHHDRDVGVTKAKFESGKIVHLMEPEYHGNPLDREGSLVFEIPGWNILDRAKAAGFSDAHMRFVLSARHAIMGSQIGPVPVLCLRK